MNRRDFLKTLGLAPVAVVAARVLPKQGETSEAGARIDAKMIDELAKGYVAAATDTRCRVYEFKNLGGFRKSLSYTSGILKLMPPIE